MDDLDKEARLQVQLAGIREGFLRRLQGELPLLGTLLARIRGGDSTVLAQLQSLAHRIHGSAATFDFAAISESAGQVDKLLLELLRVPIASIAEPGEMPRLLECGERLAREVGAATA
jgi:HPt (histidine-containing phosphotransfer) domain-containing protein